jgi:hypothetical protein
MRTSLRRVRLLVGLGLAALIVPAVWGSAAVAAEAGPNTLTPEEIAEGWLLLFDGQTLFGWKPNSQADWKAADGAISVSGSEKGLLLTTSQFGNYVLKVDFRCPQETNSGVFCRTAATPTDPAADCYEVNIAPAGTPFPTGSIAGRKKAAPQHAGADWRTFEITADGGRIAVKLGGRNVCDYTDPRPLGRGHIGLQLNAGKVEFRNVKLKPLGLAAMLNGKDLAGWKTYPELKTKAAVTPEGWLSLKDGRGQVESAGRYADFTMQLEVLVNSQGGNSGVFFRSIPGDVMNGYECQIQNGFLEGDRTKPKDCGTGGIFRRQNARRVVPDDFAWFPMTIHADGPHMAVWVGGLQVTDWTDARKPDPNPRKGLRLAAGTIQLQGHDPTTDLSFRNLRIAEMPKR